MNDENPIDEEASTSPSKGGRDWVTVGILLALAAAVIVLFVQAMGAIPESIPEAGEHARVMPVPREISEFTLTDHRGDTFGLDQLKGQWSLLFFGYTSCPDICPFVLGELARVKETLESRPESDLAMPNVVFVSVDPVRDSQTRLTDYMNFFDRDFIGVTGSNQELLKLAQGVGAYYEAPEGSEAEGYLVNHASKIFLVNEGGRFLAMLDDPHDPDEFIDLLARVQLIGDRQP